MNKFEGVPVEDGSRILAQVEAMLGEYEVLYQKWAWEGVLAESLIFVSEDLENKTDTEIQNIVRESPLVRDNSIITISKTNSGFTFANFNFIS